jgi:hypothetical protein
MTVQVPCAPGAVWAVQGRGTYVGEPPEETDGHSR